MPKPAPTPPTPAQQQDPAAHGRRRVPYQGAVPADVPADVQTSAPPAQPTPQE